MKEFFRFGFIGLVVGLSVGYVLADWVNPGGPPTPDPGLWNRPEPINVSGTDQIKVGGFGTQGPLSAPWVFPTLKLGVGSVVTGSALDTTAVNETVAVLDVNGQIRIRGGAPAAGKALIAGATGLAQWGDAVISITHSNPSSSGLIFSPSTITNTGTIGVNVAPAGGLSINAWNQLKVNVGAGLGDGLTVTAGGQVQFESCDDSETWKYDETSASWGCAAFPAPACP